MGFLQHAEGCALSGPSELAGHSGSRDHFSEDVRLLPLGESIGETM